MRRLVWSDKAREDSQKKVAYIAERNPPAAVKMADEVSPSYPSVGAAGCPGPTKSPFLACHTSWPTPSKPLQPATRSSPSCA